VYSSVVLAGWVCSTVGTETSHVRVHASLRASHLLSAGLPIIAWLVAIYVVRIFDLVWTTAERPYVPVTLANVPLASFNLADAFHAVVREAGTDVQNRHQKHADRYFSVLHFKDPFLVNTRRVNYSYY